MEDTQTPPSSLKSVKPKKYLVPSTERRVAGGILVFSFVVAIGFTLGPWSRDVIVTPDSISYLKTALSFDNTPSPLELSPTRFPPLYPFLLFLEKQLFGISPTDFVPFLNGTMAIVAVLLLFLLGTVVGRSTLLAASISAVLATSPHLQILTSPLLSEIVYLPLALAALLLFIRADEFRAHAFSALWAGAALLTRFAAISVPVGLGTTYFWGSGLKGGALKGTRYLLLAVAPLVVWMVWTGSGSGRSFHYTPIGWSELLKPIDVMLTWLHLPLNSFSRGSLTLLIIWAHYRALRTPLLRPIAHLFISTILVTFLSRIFLDAGIPLNSRILCLLYPLLLLLVLGALTHTTPLQRIATPLTLALCLLLTATNIWSTLSLSGRTQETGFNLNDPRWKTLPTLKLTEQLHAPITYSNLPDLLWLHTGLFTRSIPSLHLPGTKQPNPHYQAQLDQMMNSLRENDGRLALFRAAKWRWYLPSIETLENSVPLKTLYTGKDGAVYQALPKAEPESHSGETTLKPQAP